MKFNHHLWRAVLTGFSFFLLATYLVTAKADDIRIGSVVDQSGLQSDVSRDYLAGARTYFDQINS
jgi:ABC-type branched-subunit amino acid transport system substrate-binding protein